jgi:hypothetical protein
MGGGKCLPVTAIIIAGGLLAAMTTGHWAGVSDRIGRTPIMAIVEIGYVLK